MISFRHKKVAFAFCFSVWFFLPESVLAQEGITVKRELSSILVTSDPVGSAVHLDGEKKCNTPCRLELPPGSYQLKIIHRKREDEVVSTRVTAGEQAQVHVVLGEKTPWKLIIPTYFVGAIFTAGGISSILVHGRAGLGSSDLLADEHRFHRNLGIASVAIGLPLLTLATYLIFAGKKSHVRTSVAPFDTAFNIAPMTDSRGAVAGLSLTLGLR